MATQHGHKGHDGSDALAQLDIERGRNDRKLKSRFEHIFRKYEHDFTGVGDEFDIHTDELVVNNGHLEHMQSEVDSGTTASSRFVKTFREKLAHEDESGSSDEAHDSDDSNDDDGGGGGGGGGGDDDIQSEGSHSSSQDANAARSMRGTLAASSAMPFGVGMQKSIMLGSDRRPPRLPQLMQLLAGEGTPQCPLEIPSNQESEDESVLSEATSGTTPSPAMMEQTRGRRQSSYAESRAGSQRTTADDETVQALGMSIANQLAKLMGATSKKKKKKPTAMHRAADPVWSYPEIEQSNKSKRKRTVSPVPRPRMSSPGAISPDSRSLWAVSTQPGKRRRQDRTSSTASTAVRRFGNSSDLDASKRCWNCSLTRSSSWQKGPHGQDLCQSCGHYYEHHGRMKGFDSATPPASDVQRSAEPDHAMSTDAVSDVLAMPEPWGSPSEMLAPPELMRLSRSNVTTIDDHNPQSTLEEAPKPAPTSMKDELRVTPNIPYAANTSRQVVSSDTKWKMWTVEEDALIIRLKESERLSWDAIAHYFPNRAASAIQKEYSSKLKGVDCPARVLFNDQLHAEDVAGTAADSEASGTGTPDWQWSAQQDELLLELREGDELEWDEIAGILTGHSPAAVERRYEKLAGPRPENRQAPESGQSPEPKTGWLTLKRYTAEEDALIIQLREVEGLGWQQIAQRFDNRSVHAVQTRYSVALSPMKREGTPYVSINTIGPSSAAERSLVPVQGALATMSHESSITSREPRPRRMRHSLPATMSTSSRFSGNALLRQALGNSHRRRSYHNSMPIHGAMVEPFALDPALREPNVALHATEEGDVVLSDVGSSAASLQLEEEMLNAQRSQTESPTIDTTPAPSLASVATRRMTRQSSTAPSLEAVVQPSIATDDATDHTAKYSLHGSGLVQTVSVDVEADEADDAPYVPDAEALGLAAQQDSDEDSPPRTRRRTYRKRRKHAKSAQVADDAMDSLGEQNSPSQHASITLVENTLGTTQPPPVSFTQLVAMAFSSTSTTSMSIKDIFSWIESNYDYYSTAPRSWKNFVRDELRNNGKYEIDTARKRNSVWRLKAQQSKETSNAHDEPDEEIQVTNTIDAPPIPDSDEAEIVVSTPSQLSEPAQKRRVTFSPVVTVTTPVHGTRLKPRVPASRRGLSNKYMREQSTEPPEIPDSASPSASPLDTNTEVLASRPNATGMSLNEEGTANTRKISREASRKSGMLQGHKASTKLADKAGSADSSSSPAFVEIKTPSIIYKTPKQAGRSHIGQLKPHTGPSRRHSTPIINHKFMTPRAGTRRRVVETPARELRDPEEDELAG